jgi:hypothetical protein
MMLSTACRAAFSRRMRAAEVILQKSFAEELLGITPKPGTDNTNLADLAKPLLGKELTMRYAERTSAPSSAVSGAELIVPRIP